MVITFFSNYINHHQAPFCLEMSRIIGCDFHFVATGVVSEKRKQLGYEDMSKKFDFVVRAYENDELAYKLAIESDIVIIGSAPQKYIYERLKQGKVTLRYSERLFKDFNYFVRCLPAIVGFKLRENNNTFLLCASAFSASDYNSLGLYVGKSFKWGYFPELNVYDDVSNIIKAKEKNSILWVGRFLKYKHPELVVDLARMLKANNYSFHIKMIGIGPMEKKIKKKISLFGLNDNIQLLGSMPPEKVRKYMENAEIFLFTSDRGEGWGAVLNESMNSACAVVASNEIGSVPFLIDNNYNGIVFKSKNLNDLYCKVVSLLDNERLKSYLGENAYDTMLNLWNPKIAAERLIELSDSLLKYNHFDKYSDGPCSLCKKSFISKKW